MGFGDQFAFYGYDSDDTKSYVVKLSIAQAAEGGFSLVSNPLSAPGWPFNPKNMRHVWGKSASGKRAKLYCAAPDNTKYTSGGTFQVHGTSYTVEGAIGERRPLSALGG